MKAADQIARRLRLKDLYTLQAVAELGSMAEASRHLALSQPAISKAIADMEHTVGAVLLDRSSRGVELTDCGQLLLGRARTIFDEMRQGVADIAAMSDPTCGEIRIGTTEPLTVVLSEIIGHLSRKYPRISYVVTISDGDTLEPRSAREKARRVAEALGPYARRGRPGGRSALSGPCEKSSLFNVRMEPRRLE